MSAWPTAHSPIWKMSRKSSRSASTVQFPCLPTSNRRAAVGNGPPAALATLGDHPDGGAITVRDGRYGPYVNWGKVNATLPKGKDPASVTLEEALALITEKAGSSKGRKAPARKSAASSEKRQPRKRPLQKSPGQSQEQGQGGRGGNNWHAVFPNPIPDDPHGPSGVQPQPNRKIPQPFADTGRGPQIYRGKSRSRGQAGTRQGFQHQGRCTGLSERPVA